MSGRPEPEYALRRVMSSEQGRVMNSRLFKVYCDDLGKDHKYLFSTLKCNGYRRGKMLSRVVELVTDVAVFLHEYGSVELVTLFDDYGFPLKVFQWTGIFTLLNERNLSLQEKSKYQVEAAEVSVIKQKLSLWKKSKKPELCNVVTVGQ